MSDRTSVPGPLRGLSRSLGLFNATMIVMGGIIGSGIFMNPTDPGSLGIERSHRFVSMPNSRIVGSTEAVSSGLERLGATLDQITD
jgi:hypothetical protein